MKTKNDIKAMREAIESASRVDLVKYITPDVIDYAISKKMILFLTLVSASTIPEREYTTIKILRQIIDDPRAYKMLHMTAISNAALKGYLERISIREGIPDGIKIYGHAEKTTQVVMSISHLGERRLKEYLVDIILATEICPRIQFQSISSERNVLITFFMEVEMSARRARKRLGERVGY